MEFWQTVVVVFFTGFFTLAGAITSSYLARQSEKNKLVMATLPEKRVDTIWEFIRYCGKYYDIAFDYAKGKAEWSQFYAQYSELVDSTHVLYIYLSEEQAEELKGLLNEYNHCALNINENGGEKFTLQRKKIFRFIRPLVCPKGLQ